MANTPILESQIGSVATTWDRRTAVDTIQDPTGRDVLRFVFATPYETELGRIFDSAIVWYSQRGLVEKVGVGLNTNMESELKTLRILFMRR